MSSLVAPVVCWDAGTTDLPADTIGSLIIHNVANLTPANQQRLLEWLSNQDRRRSVIATSIEPFYRNVESGLFSDGLYYRLNTVTSCWIGNPIPATPGTRPSRLLKTLKRIVGRGKNQKLSSWPSSAA